jgi:hypothetical protein
MFLVSLTGVILRRKFLFELGFSIEGFALFAVIPLDAGLGAETGFVELVLDADCFGDFFARVFAAGCFAAFFTVFLADFFAAFLVFFTTRLLFFAVFFAAALAERPRCEFCFLAFFFFEVFFFGVATTNSFKKLSGLRILLSGYRVASASSPNTEKTSGFRSRL